jgi:hypothetical protein
MPAVREGDGASAGHDAWKLSTQKKKEGVSFLSTPGTGWTAITASCRPFSFRRLSSPFFLLELGLLSWKSGTEVSQRVV